MELCWFAVRHVACHARSLQAVVPFPYYGCTRSTSNTPYLTVPWHVPDTPNMVCFTFYVLPCDPAAKCCDYTLYKLEFDISGWLGVGQGGQGGEGALSGPLMVWWLKRACWPDLGRRVKQSKCTNNGGFSWPGLMLA